MVVVQFRWKLLRHRRSEATSFFKGGSTWIVGPNRDTLTAEEVAKGFKVPIQALSDAVNGMDSGDRLLVSEGDHEILIPGDKMKGWKIDL